MLDNVDCGLILHFYDTICTLIFSVTDMELWLCECFNCWNTNVYLTLTKNGLLLLVAGSYAGRNRWVGNPFCKHVLLKWWGEMILWQSQPEPFVSISFHAFYCGHSSCFWKIGSSVGSSTSTLTGSCWQSFRVLIECYIIAGLCVYIEKFWSAGTQTDRWCFHVVYKFSSCVKSRR